jgi:hypothetical protein
MDYNKYKNDGWGLSQLALQKINEVISDINKSTINVVEFGSGTSTKFLSDLNQDSDKEIIITTFDNDINYSYKKRENDNVTLHIRPLVECSDDSYERMFKNKEYNKSEMKLKTSEPTTRQKNSFYDIKDGDLNVDYDLMILDGPNGNGRNLSYLHMKGYLKSNSYVLVDDFTHYDFVEKLLSIFDAELICKYDENGESFVIYKIK